jgi:hypothetical protein
MAAEPAHGPGRDEDPARHAPEPGDREPMPPPPGLAGAPQASPTGPAGKVHAPVTGPAGAAQASATGRPDDAPLPAACVPPGEVPLPAASAPALDLPLPGATPDWLDDVGWAAIVAGEDEEEPADPDLEDPPLDWDELDAVIAEAREITAAEARDRAYAARRVFCGGWGAVGAAPGRRGPGQPGSAASFPGEHASPVAGFGSGFALDTAPGCAVLAEFADAVAGPDDRYPGATDDEIVGVICAWARAEAHAAARKLAATAELIRRRPAEDCAPQVPAKGAALDGSAPRDPAEDVAEDATGRPALPDAASPENAAAQMPEAWHEFAVDELSCALGESRAAAEDLLDLAHSLAARLPGTMAALRDGVLSQPKADIIAQATSALDPGESAAAEDLVLGRAARLTRPGLRAAIARAVMEIAPKKAKKRREEEAKKTRVERWMEGSGNAGLAGRELPPAQVLAADQRVTAWAKALRAAGLDGDMDVLRAKAYLDILLGMDSRPAVPSAAASPDAASPDAEPPDADPPANPWDYRPPAGPVPGSPFPAGFAARLNLTVPLATALGLADRPGEAGTLGPIDPWLARDLTHAAARNPKTTWCVTVTDADGHAIGHGCARPAPKDPRGPRTKRQKPGPPGSPGPPGGHDPPGGGPDRQRFSFTATGDHGPPGGYGTWRLSAGIPGQRDLVIAIGPVATGDCDHRHEAPGHDPGVLLRHLTEVRHATCTAPACRRPATTCDFEHNIPYEAGGRTCECNGGPKCRHHHRLKQNPKWKVEQPSPAALHWRTPAGRLYTTEPTRYPI